MIRGVFLSGVTGWGQMISTPGGQSEGKVVGTKNVERSKVHRVIDRFAFGQKVTTHRQTVNYGDQGPTR